MASEEMNYRERLFHEMLDYTSGSPTRVLEIGPKDGEDTRRLKSLGHVTTIDLPGVGEPSIVGNILYDDVLNGATFDLVWCTGVLYHNPEQLRFITRLFDALTPGGTIVLESATTRKWLLRYRNVVE